MVEASGYIYVQRIVSDAAVLSQAYDDFPTKEVLFVVGTEDDCNCDDQDVYKNPDQCWHEFGFSCSDVYPDYYVPFATVGVVGGSCKKNIQGWSRAQRWANYLSHLQDFYNRTRGINYVPNHCTYSGQHDKEAMLKSHHVRSFLGFHDEA
mmetsp:Transcript_128093/g.409535  ORF Transcript_128093/g.409535 Transcript_128093/m.409535 type:complete len:150 (-) Transcript_128093:114-563(-)